MNWNRFLDNAKAVAEKAKHAAEILEDQLNESVGASQDVLDARVKARSKQEFNLKPITDGDDDDDDDPFDDDFYNSDDDFDVSMHDEKELESDNPARFSNDVMSTGEHNEMPVKDEKEEIDYEDDGFDKKEPLGENIHDTEEQKENEVIENEKFNNVKENFDITTSSKSENNVQTPNMEIVNKPDEDSNLHSTESEKDVDDVQQDGTNSIVDQNECPRHKDAAVDIVEHSEAELDNGDSMSREDEEHDDDVNDDDANDNEVSLGSDKSDDMSIYVSKEEAALELQRSTSDVMNDPDTRDQKLLGLETELMALRKQLAMQKEDMTSKDEQMLSMTETFEREKKALETKIKETKEEAKKRIAKAKEKVDALKIQLSDASMTANHTALTSSEQDEIIKALRMEGENLAKKQCDMEQLVRDARSDIKELKEDLEKERNAKENAEKKIANLEKDLKVTKDLLSAAKAKGGLADKLDSDLLAAREEREKNAVIISNLEAELKHARAETIEMKKNMDLLLKEKVNQMETEAAVIRKEKDSLLNDLETKLRTSEREANLREDSLRHEVAELRKRWQESVRRCDALSIDLQQSSGPLLRQLESAERQNRSRANAWEELERKLRSDLEESLNENGSLTKEKNEMETEMKALHRELQSKESELETVNSRLSDISKSLRHANDRYEAVVKELDDLQVDFKTLEQRCKDKESKIISEMTVTLRESEERYNDHVDSLEVELRQEREMRQVLEEKIKEMIDEASDAEILTPYSTANRLPRNLGKADGQANILQSTLMSIDGNDEEDADTLPNYHNNIGINSGANSFAFMEEMTQAVSTAKLEVETLRNQLDESHLRRSELENELTRIREHINNKDLEIRALEDDIVEVRHMFRSQIDALMAKDNLSSKSHEKKKTVSSGSSATSSFVGMRTF